MHLQIHRGKWFADQEVYQFVYENLQYIDRPDMRVYVELASHKAEGSDWQNLFASWYELKLPVIADYLNAKKTGG